MSDLYNSRLTGGDPLRRCNKCFKPETSPSDKLKKCTGCSVALYCSRQCQRSAWSDHKPVCHSKGLNADAQVAPFGYSSANTFGRDLNDFLTAHMFALDGSARMLSNIYRDTQLANKSASVEPAGFMVMRLRCTSTRTSHVHDPAAKFAVSEQSIEDLDEHIRAETASWTSLAAYREETTRMHQDSPGFLGLLTIVYYVHGVSSCTMQFFPLWAPSPCEFPPQVRLTILEDMVDFFMDSINGGFPLRCMPGEQMIAVPGKYVRGDGRIWAWQPLFRDWDEYRVGGHPALDAAVSRAKRNFEFSIPQLIVASASFCQ
ncbi:hypothetical protein C8Q80DRAFT_1114545 [Daedaleopsis nitida]|nr:hypothetical protein C8Q80DRAFT_1114545 [Daedaleopsis nitida]